MLRQTLLDMRKALVAAGGLIGQAVALGVLHGAYLHYAQLALAALTAIGVYGASNGGVRKAPPIPELPPAGFLSPGGSPACGNRHCRRNGRG